MSASDLSTFVGLLISSWAAGFAAGYTLTKFRDGMNQVS